MTRLETWYEDDGRHVGMRDGRRFEVIAAYYSGQSPKRCGRETVEFHGVWDDDGTCGVIFTASVPMERES